FNYLGRTYQVRVQSDGKFRRTPQDITRLKARNTSGEMVPIGTVTQLKSKTIPYRVPRYNLFPAAEVQGVAAPGVATGTALRRMEELARQVLPRGLLLSGPTSLSKNSNTAHRLSSSSAQPLSSSSSSSSRNTKAGSYRWQSS